MALLKNTFLQALLVMCVMVASLVGGRALAQQAQPAAAQYGDFSDKEHCIQNYALSCSQKNIERYAEIFQPGCEFYLIESAPDTEESMLAAPAMTKHKLDRELEMAKSLFGAARQIRFEFADGTWSRVDSLWGKPCTGCWGTTRDYACSITFDSSNDSTEAPPMDVHSRMKIYVSSLEGRWKIFTIIEGKPPGEGNGPH